MPAALIRASNGAGLKIVACFDASRLSSCLVVSSEIRAAEQLRGKRLGARVEGAAMWIHTVLALGRLGPQPERDQISIVEIGDPLDIVEAFGRRLIAGAVLPARYVSSRPGKDTQSSLICTPAMCAVPAAAVGQQASCATIPTRRIDCRGFDRGGCFHPLATSASGRAGDDQSRTEANR